MTAEPNLYFRVDATAETGLGHFTRCLALAQQWRDSHGAATFVGSFGPVQSEALSAEGIAIEAVAARHPAPQDIAATLAVIPSKAAVVLDGYAFDYKYQTALADRGPLLVIDDIGHLDAYAGAALLNPNFSAAEIVYADAPARRLIGPRYALLRREFRSGSAARQVRANTAAERVLVCCGGADVRNDTARLVRALIDSAPWPLEVRVVVGPLNPHSAALEALAAPHRNVELIEHPADMRAEMCRADLTIASAGSISFELAALGIPALLFGVADNQIPGGRCIDATGAARFGGDLRELSDGQIRETIAGTLEDADAMAKMRSNGPALVDGNGVVRVCSFLTGTELD